MDRLRVNSRDASPHQANARESTVFGWVGVQAVARVAQGRAALAPETAPAGMTAATDPRRSRGAFTRFVVDFVRRSVIGLALITAVPLVYLAARDGRQLHDLSSVTERVADIERLRPLMAPRDLSISAAAAGRLLNELRTARSQASPAMRALLPKDMFPMHPATTTYARPWRTQRQTIGRFSAPLTEDRTARAALQVVLHASGGFTAAEMAHLRTLADAPIWKDIERVARAAQVDVIGGRFVLPFSDEAFSPAMPTTRFADSKELAYAGVSRAAYYLALGDVARAESALRTIVSYGFVFVDNGTSMFDALIGRVIIDIGRDGLHQLYEVTGNARGLALTASLPNRGALADTPAASRTEADAIAARRLAEANAATLPRTLRYQRLQELAFSSCGSAWEVLTGPRHEVRESFARASENLARFPSERAYLQLMFDAPSRDQPFNITGGKVRALIAGAASVAAIVLHNPRIATCTQLTLASD